MKKTLAILLSLALLITAIPFATASADTTTELTDFYVKENWDTGMQSYGYFGTDMVSIPNGDHYATIAVEPNTKYQFTAMIKCAAWGATATNYSGDYGFSISSGAANGAVSADYLLTSNACPSIASVPFDAVQIDVTFTTKATDETINIRFGRTNSNGLEVYDVYLTELCTAGTDLADATAWVAGEYTTVAQNGEAVQISAWYTVDAPIYTSLRLKPNTDYVLTADFSSNGGWLYNDGNGLIVLPASAYTKDTAATTAWTTVAGHNIGKGPYTHNYNASGVLTVNFTTGSEEDYTLGIRTKGSSLTSGTQTIDLSNFAIAEVTALDKATSAISGKFTGTNYGSIRAKSDDKAQGLRVKSTLDLSVLGEGALENCTVVEYGTLVTKKASLNGAELTIDLLDDIKMIKGVAYDQNGTDIVYELTDTTKSFTLVLINIPVERFITAYTYRAYAIIEDAEGNQTTVYGGAGTEVSVESVATDIVNSGTASADDLAAAEAALAELEEYEATLPTYTTAEDLADAANWVAGGDTTLTQLEGGVQMQAWYTVYASLFTTLNLKAHTTYTITASFEGDCYTTLLTDANGVAVVPASVYSTETASGAAWPVSLIEANNIGSGYTHNNLNSGTMTVTFTTTDETQYTLGVRDSGRGSAVTWACNPLVKFTNFAITEVAQ